MPVMRGTGVDPSTSSSLISIAAFISTARCSSRSATCAQTDRRRALAGRVPGGPGVVSVSLRQAQIPGHHDRYRVAIHHVAFEA